MSLFPKREEPPLTKPASAPIIDNTDRPAPPPKTPTLVIHPGDVSTFGINFKERPRTTHLVVHCSASRPSQDDWNARTLDNMHRRQNWLCIGYHFVITRPGRLGAARIERGRPVNAIGSHAGRANFNHHSIGICLIGGISERPQSHVPGNPWNGSDAEANFHPDQLRLLDRLIKHLHGSYRSLQDRPIEEVVIGHRDIPGETKACPSFQVGHWLKTGEMVL
jgi:N-acetylmuramoyl-L-alanine amidase